MNELVFLEPNRLGAIPFTTSDVIADFTGNSYRSIQRTIVRHVSRLETFGRVRFQITPFETNGGVQEKKIYKLNESQATLLITFLKNTDVVADFKTELVRQFYAMRAELMKRQVYREQLKPIRRELTDVVQENPDKGEWSYKIYTDLAYKSAIGKTAAQLRRERNAPQKAKAIDYMTAEEISEVAKAQNRISVLHEMGMGYEQIKALMTQKLMVGKLA